MLSIAKLYRTSRGTFETRDQAWDNRGKIIDVDSPYFKTNELVVEVTALYDDQWKRYYVLEEVDVIMKETA